MKRIPSALPGVVVIEPAVHGDARGFFMETYRESELAAMGIADRFVQDNHSRSSRGVIRGMHFQAMLEVDGINRIQLGRRMFKHGVQRSKTRIIQSRIGVWHKFQNEQIWAKWRQNKRATRWAALFYDVQ